MSLYDEIPLEERLKGIKFLSPEESKKYGGATFSSNIAFLLYEKMKEHEKEIHNNDRH